MDQPTALRMRRRPDRFDNPAKLTVHLYRGQSLINVGRALCGVSFRPFDFLASTTEVTCGKCLARMKDEP